MDIGIVGMKDEQRLDVVTDQNRANASRTELTL